MAHQESDPADETRSREFVQSLARGLEVITSFSVEHPRATLSEVADRTGLSRAAARRFLLTLADLGYVGVSGREFFLRPRVLELGYAFISSFDLTSIAQLELEGICAKVHESGSASILDGDDIVYIARAAANRIMSINLSVGSRLPAELTSMGRAILAYLSAPAQQEFLDRWQLRYPKGIENAQGNTLTRTELESILTEVRDQGFCLVDQELEIGVRSIAVPVFDKHRRVVGALNSAAHASRVDDKQLRNVVLPLLQQASARITLALPPRSLHG